MTFQRPAHPSSGPLQVTVDTAEFVQFSQRLKAFSPELRKRMRKSILKASKPVVTEIRRTIKNSPTSQTGQTRGLRKRIAAGVRAELSDSPTSKRQGLYFRATASKLEEGEKQMAGVYNKPRFRHRAWGRDDEWHEQAGSPYFQNVIQDHTTDLRQSVIDALTEAQDAVGLDRS